MRLGHGYVKPPQAAALELGFVCLFLTNFQGSELDMAQILKKEILLNPRTSEPASGDTRTAESWGKEASNWAYFLKKKVDGA